MMNLLYHDIQKCLPKFYETVHQKKNDCVAKNDYLSKDLSKKGAAFTNGKACFVEFVKKECAPEALTYLNDYDRFLDLLTVKNNCEAPFAFLEQLQCRFMIDARNEKLRLWKEKVSKKEAEEVVGMCNYIEDCSKDTCKLAVEAKRIKDDCILNEIAHTDFATCLKKMSKNECFDSMYVSKLRFADSSVNKCPEFEEKKSCLKKAMEKSCGGEVKDFDTAILSFKKWLHCPV